jgi:hypothetical protein
VKTTLRASNVKRSTPPLNETVPSMSKPAIKKSKAAKKTTKSKELDVKDLEKVTGGSLNFRPQQPAKGKATR